MNGLQNLRGHKGQQCFYADYFINYYKEKKEEK